MTPKRQPQPQASSLRGGRMNELIEEIIWVMTYYDSDAEERADPGSKLRRQAARIAEFVEQRAEAEELLRQRRFNLVRVTRRD